MAAGYSSRPYNLIDLANAADMSISRVRTAYDYEAKQPKSSAARPPNPPPATADRVAHSQ
jgi:hypothetical protein